MATHSSILAWEIPWTEEPGELQLTGSQKDQTQLSDSVQFSCSVESDSATPWTAACQASLSITNSQR